MHHASISSALSTNVQLMNLVEPENDGWNMQIHVIVKFAHRTSQTCIHSYIISYLLCYMFNIFALLQDLIDGINESTSNAWLINDSMVQKLCCGRRLNIRTTHKQTVQIGEKAK